MAEKVDDGSYAMDIVVITIAIPGQYNWEAGGIFIDSDKL